MTGDELKEFEEEVRNKPIEYLLEMKKCLLEMKERIEEKYRREDTKHTYGKYIKYGVVGEIVEKLDIINAELERMIQNEKQRH